MHTAIAAVAALIVVVGPQPTPPQADRLSVAGTWVISIESHELGLGLEQDGSALTGTLVVMGQQLPVTGAFVDRTITVATDPDAPQSFRLTGTMKDDGTMAGEMQTPHGTMRWTAERLKPPARAR